MLNEKDIENLASLSRIELTSDEKVSLATDLENILAYVSELDEVSVGAVEENETALVRNVMRADEPVSPIAKTQDIIAEMPKSKDGYLVVKKILN